MSTSVQSRCGDSHQARKRRKRRLTGCVLAGAARPCAAAGYKRPKRCSQAWSVWKVFRQYASFACGHAGPGRCRAAFLPADRARIHKLCRSAHLTDAVPFLFCDAAQIVETIREVLPAVVVRPKRLRETGGGPLHQLDATAVRRGPTTAYAAGPFRMT